MPPRIGRALPLLAVLVVVTVGLAYVAYISSPQEPGLPDLGLPTGVLSIPTEAPGAEPIILAAGDIAGCGYQADEATARILDKNAGTVLAMGDTAYDDGRPVEFERCYSPTWGRHKDRTKPVPGNHEYDTPGAAGYFDYFGDAAGKRGEGWYVFDLGDWRLYALNSNCDQVGCGPDSAQLKWLHAQVTDFERAGAGSGGGMRCSLAFFHHPVFSSGPHGSTRWLESVWAELVRGGVDVVLTAHDHSYERFGTLDLAGSPAAEGPRVFVVGTGGAQLRDFDTPLPGSEVRDAGTYGVIRLVLREADYEWRFIPVAAGEFTDSGNGPCH
jgi:hypothetical protein